MILDSQLTFHTHIDKVVEKTSTKLGLLYKTRWLFDNATALMLYKALIVPHFDFGSTIYEITPQYQLNRLQVVQNAAARLILLEDYDCAVYSMHEKLNIDTLATRRAKSMVKLTYGILHDQTPSYLYDRLQPVAHVGRLMRATESGELNVPRVHSKYGAYAFSYRGPLQWNPTSIDLKAAVNKVQLINLIKTSWKS